MNTSTPTAGTAPVTAAAAGKTARIASIDWMRGFVMILMTIDHASMAFDGSHLDDDSAMYPGAANIALPAAEFFTRWITHVCAPTFVFLAGVALALSIERRVAKGMNAWEIDKNLIVRGAIIALLDLTVISIGSGKLNFGVLFAIGTAMMCMAFLRRLPSSALLILALAWIGLGELVTDWAWDPPGSAVPAAAIFIATGTSAVAAIDISMKYALLPWLAIMMLGWVFGRQMTAFSAGKARVSPQTMLVIGGALALVLFAVLRGSQGYGDMFLPRSDNSWQQWLHVSKYPPSLTYYALELGVFSLGLALMMKIEPLIGVRRNGPLLVFGQTAMFFYLAHRLVMEIPATYFGLRGVGDLSTTYVVTAVMLLWLYPACLWYRGFKAAHPTSFLKYL